MMQDYLDQLRACATACNDCLRVTTKDEACHHSLRQCTAALRDAIRAVEGEEYFASRALVDAADACELVADRCADSENQTTRQTVEVCRTCVDICREASLVGVG